MIGNILFSKKSFRKYMKFYILLFSIILLGWLFNDIYYVDWKVKYGIPCILLVLNSFFVFLYILRIQKLLKNGKKICAKVVNFSMVNTKKIPKIYYYEDVGYIFPWTLPDEEVCIQCIDDTSKHFFEEIFINPIANRVVGKELKSSDIEYVNVLINPNNYDDYEILYMELLENGCIQEQYSFLISIVILFLVIIVIVKYIIFTQL